MSTIHDEHTSSETARLRTALNRERRSRAVLARAKDALEVVLGAGCVGFCRILSNRRRVVANAHFKAHFGWPPDTLLHRHDIEERVHEEDRAALARALTAALADGAPLDLTVRAVWPSGTTQFVALRGRSMLPEFSAQSPSHAAVQELVLVANNVTAEHRIMQELQAVAQRECELRASALATNRANLDLLSRVSHELRSPLNSMLGWNRILAMKHSADPEIQALTARVAQGGRSQLGMVNDLLDLGRMGTGKFTIDSRPMRLACVAAAALEGVSSAAQAKDITITADLAGTVGEMHGDAERLRQLIAHLLANAIKFTPRGGKVRVWLCREAATLEFGVSDTGQGICADALPHLFSRSVDGEGSHSRCVQGLGVGLLLAREIVARHGGTLQVTSEGVDRGTTVIVSLPARSSAAAASEVATCARDPGTPRPLSGIRILVADDEPEARAVAAELLRLEGAEVTVSDSAASAYEMLTARDARFDVVVSDIGMPGEDGYSLMRRLRAANIRVPAVALTGFASNQDAIAAREAGFDLHVPKPLDVGIDRLVSMLLRLSARPLAASAAESPVQGAAP
jgi:signal transduction histidine kinase/ActR/RegA family two-component response regulator